MVEDVTRHGKFLDFDVAGLHMVIHLARGGWIRWRDEVPTVPPKPSNKSPMAARVVLDDQSGLDITEAGTKKRLALYVVRDPLDVPGIASLGPDPLTDDFTLETLREILAKEGRKQLKGVLRHQDRKSTRLNSSHANISYAVFCLKKKYVSDLRPSQRRPKSSVVSLLL